MAEELPEFERSPNCPYSFKTILLNNKIRGVLVSIKDDAEDIDDAINKVTGERISIQQFNKLYVEDPTNRQPFQLLTGNDLKKHIKKQDPCNKNKEEKGKPHEEFAGVVCLNVGVGDTSDPRDCYGLAHLTEHCLYLGSGKYPKAEEAKEQLRNVKGIANAATSHFNTEYFITCPQESKFEEAIARLSDMIADPMLQPERILKERHAVDCEFLIRKRRSSIGLLQILRSLTPPDHPIHRLGCGNLNTLSHKDLPEKMKEFHKQLYIGKLMTLTMVSTIPIAKLEQMAIKYFGKIPEGCTEKIYPPLTWKNTTNKPCSSEFQSLTKMLNYKHHSNLLISFALSPKYWKAFGSKPLRYISYLLRNRSIGSLRYYLLEEGYTLDFYAGPLEYEFCHTEFYSFFNILIVLSNKGLHNYEHVLEATFSYIRLLQEKGAHEWYFKEIQKYHQIKFHYNYQTNHTFVRRPKELALEYCFFMHGVHPWKILTSKHLVAYYDSNLTNEALNELRPDRANFTLTSRSFKSIANMTEPFYGTKYTREKISPDLMDKMTNSNHKFRFFLPRSNPYLNLKIGKLFSAAPKHTVPPRITKVKAHKREKAVILRGEMIPPRDGHLAKVKCACFFRTDMMRKWNAKYLSLVCEMMSYLLELAINAKHKPSSGSTVNINTGFTATPHNISIYIHCPSQLLEIIFRDVLKIFMDLERIISKGQFMAKKERLIGLELESWQSDINFADPLEKFIFSSANYSFTLFLARVKGSKSSHNLTYEQFLTDMKDYRKEMFLTVTLEGCVNSAQVKAMKQIIEPLNYWPMDISAKSVFGKPLPPRTSKLPLGERALRIFSNLPISPTSFIKNYYQFDHSVPVKLVSGMAQILFSEGYYELRTNQHLGYHTKILSFETGGVPFIVVEVNTRARWYTPGYITQQIDKFWIQMHQKFFLSQEDFAVFAKRYSKNPPSYVVLKDIFERYLLKTGENFRLFSLQITSPIENTRRSIPKDCTDKAKQMGKYIFIKPSRSVGDLKYSTSKKKKNDTEDDYFVLDIDEFKNSLEKFSVQVGEDDGDEDDQINPFTGAEGETSEEEEILP